MSRESGAIDAHIDLYDPDGNKETGTNCSNYTHVQIDHQLLKSGTYTIADS